LTLAALLLAGALNLTLSFPALAQLRIGQPSGFSACFKSQHTP
jgi:hypothetical protein